MHPLLVTVMKAMLAALLLLDCCTNFALALKYSPQLVKDVMELPAVDQCDVGYVYEHGSDNILIELFELLPGER